MEYPSPPSSPEMASKPSTPMTMYSKGCSSELISVCSVPGLTIITSLMVMGTVFPVRLRQPEPPVTKNISAHGWV